MLANNTSNFRLIFTHFTSLSDFHRLNTLGLFVIYTGLARSYKNNKKNNSSNHCSITMGSVSLQLGCFLSNHRVLEKTTVFYTLTGCEKKFHFLFFMLTD